MNQTYTKESLPIISELTAYSLNHDLQSALRNERNLDEKGNPNPKETKCSFSQSIPARVTALQIIKKYNLFTLGSDFLVGVKIELSESGREAAKVGIEQYLETKSDRLENYVERFVRNK